MSKKKKNLCLLCMFYEIGEGIIDYCNNTNGNVQKVFHNHLVVGECEGFKHE